MQLMQLTVKEGIVQGIPYYPSPNYNQRPADSIINLVILHNISLPPGTFSGDAIIDFFQNKLDIDADPYYQQIKETRVSAHFLIRRDGLLIQFVPLHLRAWHAGVSSFDGVPNCNDYSIGIELEGTDDIPYELCQYRSLVNLLVLLKRINPAVTNERIVGHSDVAPDRKTDPGSAFDWGFLRGELCT